MSDKLNRLLHNKKFLIGLLIAVVIALIACIIALTLIQKTPEPEPIPEVTECIHTYDSTCDATCNICGETRIVGEHKYDTVCDAYCNICNAVRPISHQYTNACDNTCNLCFAIREVGNHVYDNDCDATCNICNDIRITGAHVYDNTSDSTCNICGAIREILHIVHIYDNACDATCNECNATRNIVHVYDNGCDDVCNICNYIRDNIYHTYDHECDDICNICNAVRLTSHSYTNVCDADCNICGETRTVTHFYSNECDNTCNLCGYTRTSYHVYDNDADEDCNVCGFVRTAYLIWNNSLANPLLMYPNDFTNSHYLSDLIFNNYTPFDEYSMSKVNGVVKTYKKTGDDTLEKYYGYSQYGQYTLSYDGTNYSYTIPHNNSMMFPLATFQDITYDVDTGTYMFSDTYAKQLVYVLSNMLEANIDDDMLSVLEIQCTTNFKLENKKIVNIYTDLYLLEDNEKYVIMYGTYNNVEGVIEFEVGVDMLVVSNVNIVLTPVESGTYNVMFNSSLSSVFDNEVQNTSFAGLLKFTDDDTITPETMQQINDLNTLLEQCNTIKQQYAGPYYMNDYCDCSEYAFYDEEHGVYILLSGNYDEEDGYVYAFSGIASFIEDNYGIVAADNENNIVVVKHCWEEELMEILREKYSNEYTSAYVDATIAVFDEEYNVYVIFEDMWSDNEYYVSEFVLEYDPITQSQGIIDGTYLQITRTSLIDTSILKFRDYNVIGITDCYMFSIYIPELKMYMYYQYFDEELYYSGYGTFIMDCVAIYNENTKTITISSHSHV